MTEDERIGEETRAALAHVRAGRIDEAVVHFERASKLAPDDLLLRNNLSAALTECGRHEEALAILDAIVKQDPGYPEAHHNRGVTLRSLGRLDDSIKATSAALQLRPDYADAWTSLAISLAEVGRLAEADEACSRALSLAPRSAVAALTLGRIAARKGNLKRALHLFSQVISLDPNSGDAYIAAGIVLRRLDRLDEAIECFKTASGLPDHTAEAFLRLGDAQASKRQRRAAIASFDQALKLNPKLEFARVQRLHLLAWQCQWDLISEEISQLPNLGLHNDPVSPFALIALEDAPERHRIRSERFAAHSYGGVQVLAEQNRKPESGGRIRLGYFSCDFQSHATAFLAARLFELHDRKQFEVHAFNYGPPIEDAMRARLRRAFDHFHDIAASSDESAAMLVRELSIDIAIDLKGYTEGQRMGILAYRPCPVQVTFLGYPGTTGAPFIDYLVSDPIVIPNAERQCYSERLIVLPHCYQPNDDRRSGGDEGSRADHGLPHDAFVFASFNHSWKIGPDEFDCWAHLMRKVDGSILWLLRSDPDAEANLRKEIERRKVAQERLVFAPMLPHEQHLGRLVHADVFLDTFRYGAHTTASDAVWAGVPIITCTGRGFAARVATSILHAAGVPELATDSRTAYRDLALSLAREPLRLSGIREKLIAARADAPFFDSKRFARALEHGLVEAYRRRCAGLFPGDIVVETRQ